MELPWGKRRRERPWERREKNTKASEDYRVVGLYTIKPSYFYYARPAIVTYNPLFLKLTENYDVQQCGLKTDPLLHSLSVSDLRFRASQKNGHVGGWRGCLLKSPRCKIFSVVTTLDHFPWHPQLLFPFSKSQLNQLNSTGLRAS